MLYSLYCEIFAYRHPLPWNAMHAYERELWAKVEISYGVEWVMSNG